LYRHFESREALALAALDHAIAQVRDRLLATLEGQDTAPQRLHALLDAYQPDSDAAARDIPLPGGCPIMNCAIEADHANEVLRERALGAMRQWRGLVERIVRAGCKAGELRAGLDAGEVSAVLVGQLEGAVMLSQLHASAQPLRAALRHLHAYIDRDLCP
jgi:AcrR family transcriptional regulator